MNWSRTVWLLGICWLLCASIEAQQRQREPLNPLEIDQLRDTAQDADGRLKLFVQFARARLVSLEQMRADPKVTDRAKQTHDKLQDFLDVYDELDDNLENFVDRKADVRKPLKAIIEADTEFQAKLRALKSSAETSKEEVQQYQFLLANVLDTVDESTQDHRQLMTEQEELAKRKKKH